MKKIFYGTLLTLTTLIISFLCVYFKAKSDCMGILENYSPKPVLKFSSVKFSQTDIIKFVFDTHYETPHSTLSWNLRYWSVDEIDKFIFIWGSKKTSQ
ncbi:hypothetical protein [Candidatus Uabimicrobium sp. HlEnr_7]|uniref:hypothetical protein n=1 Tax=Candidatus Uabimicrobium helgolandensis TaxID=3095367 RepID=UPI003555C351